MKNFLLLLLSFSSTALAQSTDTKSDSLYIVTYTPGSLWDNSKSPGDQQFFKEHSGFMGKLRKAGTTKLGARYGDKGMIIIHASSLKDAHQIILADQAVVNKLFVADIQKLNVFFDGCVQRPE